jgi:hypothetical protein
MKKFKRIMMSLLLSKQERVMIWNALWFSNHTYRRRGNVDGAAAVQIVMNSTEHVLGVNKKTFTKEEVDQIVKDVVEASQKATSDVIGHIVNREFKKGYKAGQKAMGEEIEKYADTLRPFGESEKIDFAVVPGMELDKEKCDVCENKKDCIIYQMVFNHDSEEEKAETKEDAEEAPKNEEQAPKEDAQSEEVPKEEAEK